MRIESIDVYWAKLPLAFVWKTSYADQYYTDTILVRMEGGGHVAWGESCPPLLPGYSAEHTLATFHTVREHMAPRIIGQDIEAAEDFLDRLALIKGNQFARAALEIAWWVLDAKRRGLPAHQAQVPARLGPAHGGGGALDLPAAHFPHRLQRRLLAGRHRDVPEARPLPPCHDRTAPGRRRYEPRQPRRSPAGHRDTRVPRRERAEPGSRAGGHSTG